MTIDLLLFHHHRSLFMTRRFTSTAHFFRRIFHLTLHLGCTFSILVCTSLLSTEHANLAYPMFRFYHQYVTFSSPRYSNSLTNHCNQALKYSLIRRHSFSISTKPCCLTSPESNISINLKLANTTYPYTLLNNLISMCTSYPCNTLSSSREYNIYALPY